MQSVRTAKTLISIGCALLLACGDDGAECALNSDCDEGFYCGSGSCSRDCVVDDDCEGSMTCDAIGKCRVATPIPDMSMPEADGGPADAGTDAAVAEDLGTSDGGPDDGGDVEPDAFEPDGGPGDAGIPVDSGVDLGLTGPVLLFSEYVEGSSLNKAIEIANIGSASIDLEAETCILERFTNGGSATGATVGLTGTLAAGDVHVVCNSALTDPPRSTVCDQESTLVSHNGDDGYVLLCDGVVLDSFGQDDGMDPGNSWSGGGLSTQDETLRRKCTVIMGDTDVTDAFDPSIEWNGFALNTLDGLGTRGCP